MRAVLIAAILAGTAAPAFAAPPCKDAKGKFIACPKPAAAAKRCKLGGKFAKCGTPGAKPV